MTDPLTEKPEVCPSCQTLIWIAPGVGPFCPNPECWRILDLRPESTKETPRRHLYSGGTTTSDLCDCGLTMMDPIHIHARHPSKTLVERLRSQDTVCSAGEACMCRKKCPLQREAADELERLQRDLRGVEACYGQVNAANDRMRAALERWQSECTGKNGSQMDCAPMPPDETTAAHEHEWTDVARCLVCGLTYDHFDPTASKDHDLAAQETPVAHSESPLAWFLKQSPEFKEAVYTSAMEKVDDTQNAIIRRAEEKLRPGPGAEVSASGQVFWNTRDLINQQRARERAVVPETISAPDCMKCGGAGWLWGGELDNPDEVTAADTMTQYSCDGETCRALKTESGTPRREAGDRAGPQVSRQLPKEMTLFDAIAHGDAEHRAWLKQAIEDHFAGRPVLRPNLTPEKTSGHPVELWHGKRKVSIYAAELMRCPGWGPDHQMWGPRTLDSVQKAVDWLYSPEETSEPISDSELSAELGRLREHIEMNSIELEQHARRVLYRNIRKLYRR